MGEILYCKAERSVRLNRKEVLFQDVAGVIGKNRELAEKVKKLQIYDFSDAQSIVVLSVLKIIELIQKEYPDVDIRNLGETDVVLEYVPDTVKKPWEVFKVICVCVFTFFGSAFAIMTFQNDVGVADVFQQFYEQVMHRPSDGFTILELAYSFGLALGIFVFFNHLEKKKVTHDPTPMQVQMRKYEQDVDMTFIENSSRKGSNIDVD